MLGGAVVYVGDLTRMQTFYERCFAWTVVESTDDHCSLRSPAGLVTLVRSADAVPTATPPHRRSQTAIKLTIEVASITDVRVAIAEAGGTTDPESSEWTFHDARHCDAVDPEGNVIALVEALSATDQMYPAKQ